MILLLGFAFLSGLVTILAPCIWPLLPIVLSSSVAGKGHKRPLGITLGLMLSFGFFTLAISYLLQLFHLDTNILRLFSVIIIGILGLTMLIPALSRILEGWVSRLSGILGQREVKSNDFSTGFITGLSLGIVWAPCAGPILATIATLAAMGQVTVALVFVTIAYVLGVGIPLFVFAFAGQKLFSKTKFLSPYTGRVQQIFGIIMLLTAIAIYTNYDKVLELKLLNAFPVLSQSLNGFETSQQVQQELNTLKGKNVGQQVIDNSGLFNTNYPAPEFSGVTKWLNTDHPLTMQELRGKVVLIDFWTYTCINCIRTLPFVTNWYDKYKDQGFVVIGVHTPEFDFEHDSNNVLQAIKQYNIHYPVPQDNDYGTWNAFSNQYWPAEYLIDVHGNIRRTHFGEGEYDQTEKAIQELLKEAGKNVGGSLVDMPDQTPVGQNSPETYLGSNRMQYYYPSGNLLSGQQKLTVNNTPPANSFSLGGEWNITSENAISGKDAVLVYHFIADKVFLVLRPPVGVFHCPKDMVDCGSGKIRVFLDGKVVDSASAGLDVHDGIVTVNQDRLYNLIDLHGNPGSHILRLEFQTTGIEAFAFTFG